MSITQQISSATSLLSAVDAVRNVRALLVLLGSFVAGALIWGLGGLLAVQAGFLVGALFFLIGAAVVFYGSNAAGIMIMDEVKGARSRPAVAAIITSLTTSHRLLLALLLVGVIYLAGLLVLAIVLLICKIPFLGPLLYTVVFPISVVVAGVAIFALYAVVLPLAAPAVWDGAGTLQAVSRLLAIARSRIVSVLIMMALLFFLVGIVAGFIALIMLSGTALTLGMSAGILDMGGSLFSAFGMGGFGGYAGSGAGYMAAAAIGGGVVYAIAFSLPGLVMLRGCCQVYLANLQGVDVAGMESQLKGSMDAARRKAEELRAQAAAAAAAASAAAAEAAAKAKAPPPALPPAVEPPVAAPVYKCPQCHEPYVAGDAFCGNCGNRLAS